MIVWLLRCKKCQSKVLCFRQLFNCNWLHIITNTESFVFGSVLIIKFACDQWDIEHALGGMSVGTILFYLGSYHDPNDVLQILNVFPICFQSHLTFIHKVCPIKFSPSPLYGFAKGEAQIFHVKASIVGSFQSFSLHFILF